MSFSRPTAEPPNSGVYLNYHPSSVFTVSEEDPLVSPPTAPSFQLPSLRTRSKILSSRSSVITRLSGTTRASEDSGYHSHSTLNDKTPLPFQYSCVFFNCGFRSFSYQEYETHVTQVHARGQPFVHYDPPVWNQQLGDNLSEDEDVNLAPSYSAGDVYEPFESKSLNRKTKLRLSVRRLKDRLMQGTTKSSTASVKSSESTPISASSDSAVSYLEQAPDPVLAKSEQIPNSPVPHVKQPAAALVPLQHPKEDFYAPYPELSALPVEECRERHELDASASCLGTPTDGDDITEASADILSGTNYRGSDAKASFKTPAIPMTADVEVSDNTSFAIHTEMDQTPCVPQQQSRTPCSCYSPIDVSPQAAADYRENTADGMTSSSRPSSFCEGSDLRKEVAELRAMVSLLLQRTKPSRSPSFRSEELRASVMYENSTISFRDGQRLDSPTQSSFDRFEQASISRVSSRASQASFSRQSRPGLESNRSSRCLSEPPRERILLTDWLTFTRKRGNDSSSTSSSYNSTSYSNGRAPFLNRSSAGPAQNRTGDNDGGPEEHRQQGSRKRQRLEQSEIIRDRFPCIFNVAEPQQFSGTEHLKCHEHISQLLRHLRSHNFFACQRCFTRFPNMASQNAHKQDPCIKICYKRSCKRRYPAEETLPSTCQCITTPEEQWHELFRLQYPHRSPPEVFSAPEQPSVDAGDALFDYETYAAAPASHLSPNESIRSPTLPKRPFSNMDPPPRSQSPARRNAVPVEDPGPTQQLPTLANDDRKLKDEVQSLRQEVQVLGQRLSQPLRREKELEMVLKNIWQALLRTGSPDAQPDSALWDLVALHTPNVLSSASSHGVHQQSRDSQAVVPDGVPQASTNLFNSFPDENLFIPVNWLRSADAHGKESGYGSLPG